MNNILDRMRATTPDKLEDVSGSFDDLPTPTYVRRHPKGMTRIVEGATDLQPTTVRQGRPSGNYDPSHRNNMATGKIITDGPEDRRTERQIELMDSLISQLRELDTETADKAQAYTTKMTDHGKWTPGRDGNASDWIGRMIAKVRELKAKPAPTTGAWATWRTLAAELVEIGGQHGARFAVKTEDGAANDLAFWWIVKKDGPQGPRYFLRQVIGGRGAVRVRMSPEAMVSIANKIKNTGPVEAMLKYGQEIGDCGHCGRELTNDVSRAFGMGPKCRKDKGM